MNQFKVDRSGNSPLIFDGELLSESKGRCRHALEHNRWHNIRIYRTAGGRYVVAIEYRTIWDGEERRSIAEACREPTEVTTLLRSYNPEEAVYIPTPNISKFEAESVKTLRDLRRRFEAQVSEVLADRPEFGEQID